MHFQAFFRTHPFVIVLGLLALTSCQDVFNPDGVDLMDADEVGELESQVNAVVPNDARVLELQLLKPASQIEEFTERVKQVHLYVLEGEERVLYTGELGGESLKRGRSRSLSSRELETIESRILPLSEIEYEPITRNVERAVEMVPFGYSYEGIGSYSFLMSDSGHVEHRFLLEVTKNGEDQEVHGRTVSTIYYELWFRSDSQGQIIMEE